MDPILNPYSPGAGMPPPELAGREDILEKVAIALARTRACRSAKSVMLVGLRGVGKTVLIAKGMVWSPGHGKTAFTVPRFDGFMRRIMPGAGGR